jgi:hypothetical protein
MDLFLVDSPVGLTAEALLVERLVAGTLTRNEYRTAMAELAARQPST